MICVDGMMYVHAIYLYTVYMHYQYVYMNIYMMSINKYNIYIYIYIIYIYIWHIYTYTHTLLHNILLLYVIRDTIGMQIIKKKRAFYITKTAAICRHLSHLSLQRPSPFASHHRRSPGRHSLFFGPI